MLQIIQEIAWPLHIDGSTNSQVSFLPTAIVNFFPGMPIDRDRNNKWRYRKIYPGTLHHNSQEIPKPYISLPITKVVRIPTPLPLVSMMDSFRKYEDSVNDAWSNEEVEESSSSNNSSRAPLPMNGCFPGHGANNRLSSEHLRTKGLQRLALQAGSSTRVTRPGMAVRSHSHSSDVAASKRSPVNDNSFLTNTAHSTPLVFLPRQTQKSDKFLKLLSEKIIDMENLRKLSWSGIPMELRGRVWKLLCGYAPPVGDLKKLRESIERKREEYNSLVSEYYPKREDEQYKDAFRQIHIDVPRMCPLVPLFQQTLIQEIFERILFIWALRNPASGYVQGINDLVTPYFLVFLRDYIPGSDPIEIFQLDTLPPKQIAEIEADCFWCLSQLLSSIQNNYTFAQPGIQQRVLQLKDLIQRVDNDLHRHLEKCLVEYLQFSFRWMNNLLIRELPLKCVIRLWDSYHSEPDGFASFHVYVCASFLLWWSEDLRSQPDFQHCLLLLQNLPTQNWTEDEVERMLAKAFMLKYAFADAPKHLKS